ncbi:MAG: MoaD/ThiS family protein [Tissierellales bacterium]|nr:MoaD/ThiS family protein [Tissierellales bacterium]MBN2828286.1 MoaD/ThiS family protein [Tissierellales bacterium]
MELEISEVFLEISRVKKINKIELKKDCTIKELMEKLEIKNTEYAIFFVNDQIKKETDILNNRDRLSVLPMFGGG